MTKGFPEIGSLSPVEEHDGVLVKREDLYTYPNGVNGSKLRACEQLLQAAQLAGYDTVVSAAACISPQSAITASVAQRLGMQTHVIVGGTTADKAIANHTSIHLAAEAGAQVTAVSVGYNPYLQKSGRELADVLGAYHLQYGITTPPNASEEDVRSFHAVVSQQVQNLPDEATTLVLPFGSGNTGAGVLSGLMLNGANVKRIALMAIGPNRIPWLQDRLKVLGTSWGELTDAFNVEIYELHPTFATYGDRMPESLGDLVLHPTYEGKVVRYLDLVGPRWWVDGSALLWCVGGPLPRRKGFSS